MRLARPIVKAKVILLQIQKTHKMSQAQIARFLDIPEGTLNAWMNGTVKCRHDKMLMLALLEVDRRLSLMDDLKVIAKRSRKNG